MNLLNIDGSAQITKYEDGNLVKKMSIIGILIGLGAGGAGVFLLQNVILKNKRTQIIREAEQEAENIKKEKMLQAKEKFLVLKEEHETAMKEKERRIQST